MPDAKAVDLGAARLRSGHSTDRATALGKATAFGNCNLRTVDAMYMLLCGLCCFFSCSCGVVLSLAPDPILFSFFSKVNKSCLTYLCTIILFP